VTLCVLWCVAKHCTVVHVVVVLFVREAKMEWNMRNKIVHSFYIKIYLRLHCLDTLRYDVTIVPLIQRRLRSYAISIQF